MKMWDIPPPIGFNNLELSCPYSMQFTATNCMIRITLVQVKINPNNSNTKIQMQNTRASKIFQYNKSLSPKIMVKFRIEIDQDKNKSKNLH